MICSSVGSRASPNRPSSERRLLTRSVMSRNSVAAGTAPPAGSNAQIRPSCSVTSIRPSCIWTRLVGALNSRSVHSGSNRSVSRGGAPVGFGKVGGGDVGGGGVGDAGTIPVGIVVGVEVGAVVGDGCARDVRVSGITEAGVEVGAIGGSAGIPWHPTASARSTTVRIVVIAVTFSRYYVSCAYSLRVVCQNQDHQDSRICRIETFWSRELLILIIHKSRKS